MQYVWLEKMASEGSIRPEVKARIYEDCSQLFKLAGNVEDEELVNALGDLARKGGWALGGLAAAKVWDRLVGTYKRGKTVAAIQKNEAAIRTDPAFNDYQERAVKRFQELAEIAPTLAAHPDRARHLVGNALHTGFSSDDKNHLAVLQAIYTSKDPGYAKKINDKNPLKQEKVSAERLGEMYADILGIVKEAGFFGSMADGFRRAGAATGDATAKAMGGIRPGTAASVLQHIALVSAIPLLAGVGQGIMKEYSASRDSKVMAAKLRESFNTAMQQAKKDEGTSTDKLTLNDNPAEALRAFQALVHFAPHVAMNPDAARTFMLQTVSNANLIAAPDAKQLTDIEKNLAGAGRSSPFMEGFSGAVKAVGLGEGIRSTIKDTMAPLSSRTQSAVARDIGMPGSKPRGNHG